jgi:hypothetical protein
MRLEAHPLATLFPLIEGAQFDELVADIKANGIQDTIDLYQGKILDGRNRYNAATAAGVEIKARHVRHFRPELYGDPLTYVISKNLRRRQLNDIQRASVAGKIANLSHGGDRSKPPIGGLSVEKSADVLNVAPRQVERARVVHEHGAPELREALDRGEIAVSLAEKIARLPQSEQPGEVARALPYGARSIMGSRFEPDDSLDFFPTPPWATRALIECVFPLLQPRGECLGNSVWEPACGEGHMADVLREYCPRVKATDVFDYGYGKTEDFLTAESFMWPHDWIITNPPFGEKTEQFVLRAIALATVGVAMFVRLQWLESIGRYEAIFRDTPPTLIAFFCERVNLCKGRWEPDGSTATAYIWLVWLKGESPRAPFWIPPGQREALTHPDDAERFTAHPVIKRTPTHDPETGEIIERRSARA